MLKKMLQKWINRFLFPARYPYPKYDVLYEQYEGQGHFHEQIDSEIRKRKRIWWRWQGFRLVRFIVVLVAAILVTRHGEAPGLAAVLWIIVSITLLRQVVFRITHPLIGRRLIEKEEKEEEEAVREQKRRDDVRFDVKLGALMEVVRNKELRSEEWNHARQWIIEDIGGGDEAEDSVDEVMVGFRDRETPLRSLDTETIVSVMDETERRSVLRLAIRVAGADGIVSPAERASLGYIAEQLDIDEGTLDTLIEIGLGSAQGIEAGSEPPRQQDPPEREAPQARAADDTVDAVATGLMAVVKLKSPGSPEWVHARQSLAQRASISEAEADVMMLRASDGDVDASGLAEGERVALLREAIDLAALDGTVDADERAALTQLAGSLDMEESLVDGLAQIALAAQQEAGDQAGLD